MDDQWLPVGESSNVSANVSLWTVHTGDVVYVSGCSDKELEQFKTSVQSVFFKTKFKVPLSCRQIVRLSVCVADG